MTGAEDFEAETKSRGEELKALGMAKKVIVEATSGASDLSYSFLQTTISSSADLANVEALRLVRDLAQRQNSAALAQLATRMDTAMHSNSKDIFAKVKGLISDMIEKLLKEAEADATEKAFCDKEMAETEAKQSDKEATIEKLTTQIDSMSAKSAKLKEEEKAAYDKNSAEMKKGIEGVKLALKVLNEYYAKEDKAHSSADGAGSGIIGLLEVCESDFSKGLAEMNAAEQTAVSEYEAASKENEITTATKGQDEKYKTKEAKGLDKSTSESNA